MYDIHPSMNNTSIIKGRDDNECTYTFSSSEHHNIEMDTRDNIKNEPHIIDTTQHQSSTTFSNQITQEIMDLLVLSLTIFKRLIN
jgi:hypothetical protein